MCSPVCTCLAPVPIFAEPMLLGISYRLCTIYLFHRPVSAPHRGRYNIDAINYFPVSVRVVPVDNSRGQTDVSSYGVIFKLTATFFFLFRKANSVLEPSSCRRQCFTWQLRYLDFFGIFEETRAVARVTGMMIRSDRR